VREVVALAEGPDGAPVAVAEDAVAVFLDGAFTTYRLNVPARILGAAAREGALVLATPGKLYTLHLPESGLVGLTRNGVHLVHVAGKRKRPPYVAGALDLAAPTDLTALAAQGQTIYLGTRTLGTTRVVVARDRSAVSHLRTRELVAGARGLSIACAAPDRCYVATGGAASWRFDGRAFSRVAIDADRPAIALAMVRSPAGEVLALYREPSAREVRVARLDDGAFVRLADLSIETPSGAALLSFARFAPDGLLWLGLSYVDADSDVRPYGVALVNLDVAAVAYHREGERRAGVMPVPNDVVDVAFAGDEIWFASGSGAARLAGHDQLRVWTEADALKSEILHGIVATPGGHVFIASTSGVGQFDGSRWSYPPALSMVTHAIAQGRDGRLWLATERGLVAYDGKRALRLDRRGGLLDDRVFDVAVDAHGRIWARGGDGISIVTP
jgi:hypothetical protein